MRQLLLWAVLACVQALPVSAQDWRQVGLGPLIFEVPEDWQFFYDHSVGAGGFSPDAAGFSNTSGGVVLGPGPLAALDPTSTILPNLPPDLSGIAAAEVVTDQPLQPGFTSRNFDIDATYAPVTLILAAPEGQEAAYQPAFDRVLASLQVLPNQPFEVPDPSGEWFLGAEIPLTLTASNLGDSFAMEGPDFSTIVTRRDPVTLQIAYDGGVSFGLISTDGQQVTWDDGMVWTREAGAMTSSPATPNGEPMSMAGVSSEMVLGDVAVWVPSLWPQNQRVDEEGRDFAEATDPNGGATARLVILPGASDAAAFAALTETVAAGLTGQNVPPNEPWTYAYDASGPADWPNGARQTQLRLRAAPVASGLAVLLVKWAEDGDYLTQDDAGQVIYGAMLTPIKPEGAPKVAPEEKPEDKDVIPLFAGALGEDWVPVATAGGNYEAHAKIAKKTLVVDVPAGSGWAKAGIRSARPLVTFDGPQDRVSLAYRIGPARSSNFVLTLDSRAEDEEWSAHDARLHWTTTADGASSHVALFIRQQQVDAADVAGPVEKTLVLRLDAAGGVQVLLPGGRSLEGTIPAPLPRDGYYLHVVTHAAEANGPAKLAISQINLRHGLAPALAIAPWPERPAKQVLFASEKSHVWQPLVIAGGDFARDAKIGKTGLTVDVAANLGWATAGLYSPEPVVWLEDFHDDAETTLVWDIDPNASDGFVLALTRPGAGNYPGEAPAPHLVFLFLPDPANGKGRAALRLNPDFANDAWAADGPQTTPSRVEMLIRPGEVTVSAEGYDPVTLPWSQAVNGAGLRAYAYGASYAPEVAHRFHLTGLTLSQKPASTPAPEGPPQGADPLPMQVLFDGQQSPAWEPAAVSGGNFDSFARYGKNRLSVAVPEGNLWAMTGLLSRDPVFTLDERHYLTPQRLDLQLDPKTPQTFNLALSATKTADMWLDHMAWVSLTPIEGRAVWNLTLHYSPYSVWTREVDAGWIASEWDGHVTVDLGIGWASVRLGEGGPLVRGEVPSMQGQAVYATVMAVAPAENRPAQMELLHIETGLVTPPGLTAADRWQLVDTATFNPEGFLSDISADLEILP